MAMATASAQQLASVVALGAGQRISIQGDCRTKRLTCRPSATGLPVIECSKHAQKKATAHHNETRPKKHSPYDRNRKGPTFYPPVGKAPPIWGFDTGDVSTSTAGDEDTSSSIPPLEAAST